MAKKEIRTVDGFHAAVDQLTIWNGLSKIVDEKLAAIKVTIAEIAQSAQQVGETSVYLAGQFSDALTLYAEEAMKWTKETNEAGRTQIETLLNALKVKKADQPTVEALKSGLFKQVISYEINPDSLDKLVEMYPELYTQLAAVQIVKKARTPFKITVGKVNEGAVTEILAAVEAATERANEANKKASKKVKA